MMGRIVVLYFFLAALISCNTKTGETFTVEGIIKNATSNTIYLEQNLANSERPLIIDSSTIGSDGRFKLTTTTKEEGIYSLRAGQAELPFAVLINDTKKLSVNADMNSPGAYTVTGSPASEGLISFDKKVGQNLLSLSDFSMHYDSVVRIKATNPVQQRTLDSLRLADSTGYENTAREMKNFVANLAEKSNSAALIIYAVSTFQQVAAKYQFKGFNPTEISGIVNEAVSKFPNNPTLQDWKKALRPGKAPEFALADTSGKAFSLASLKGRYVLIDFWASWCQPCRKENPNVVAAYNRYKTKNFTILGVSLDENKKAWMEAIQTDSLQWNHVSDLKGWQSQVVSMYGVNAIPYNFLLDPEGNIIAEDIRGKDLFTTLDKFLK